MGIPRGAWNEVYTNQGAKTDCSGCCVVFAKGGIIGSMRILITIPHFWNPNGDGRYGSTQPDPRPRVAALTQALRALRIHYASPQEFWYREGNRLHPQPANQQNLIDLEIVICTSRDLHALDKVSVPDGTYIHHPTDCAPMLLGFECHKVLQGAIGRYDLYGYLEDDLILYDPYFFAKVAWFARTQGAESVLQPNRYESAVTQTELKKVYIDFEFRPPAEMMARAGEPLLLPFLDQTIALRRTSNPHAACFFLTAEQMTYWVQQADFLSGDTSYVGPLESAASLGLYRNFKVYKPAPENASFLEVEHAGQVWSQRLAAVRFPPSSQSAAKR